MTFLSEFLPFLGEMAIIILLFIWTMKKLKSIVIQGIMFLFLGSWGFTVIFQLFFFLWFYISMPFR